MVRTHPPQYLLFHHASTWPRAGTTVSTPTVLDVNARPQFITSMPDLGYPATQKTNVRVLYDHEALYFACLCYDTQPDNLTVTSLERDFNAVNADVLTVVLDPALDRRNAFMFTVNPYGAIGDAHVLRGGRGVASEPPRGL